MVYVSKLYVQCFYSMGFAAGDHDHAHVRNAKRQIVRAWPSDSLIKDSLCFGKRHYCTINTLGPFIVVGWVRFFSDGCILDIAYQTFITLPVIIIYNNYYVEISRRAYQLNATFLWTINRNFGEFMNKSIFQWVLAGGWHGCHAIPSH